MDDLLHFGDGNAAEDVTHLREDDEMTPNVVVFSACGATDGVSDFNERNSWDVVIDFNKSDATDDCATGANECIAPGDDVECIKRNVTGDDIDSDESDVTREFPEFGESGVTDDDVDNVSDIRKYDVGSTNGEFELETLLRCVVSRPISNLLL